MNKALAKYEKNTRKIREKDEKNTRKRRDKYGTNTGRLLGFRGVKFNYKRADTRCLGRGKGRGVKTAKRLAGKEKKDKENEERKESKEKDERKEPKERRKRNERKERRKRK